MVTATATGRVKQITANMAIRSYVASYIFTYVYLSITSGQVTNTT